MHKATQLFITLLATAGGVLAQYNGIFREAIQLKTDDGKCLDTYGWDLAGHAAPFLIDLDRDGKKDLVVGSLGGRFAHLPNVATAGSPIFSAKYEIIQANGEEARIKNWCCMAVAPQFGDLNRDGLIDLVAGSYGGPLYALLGTKAHGFAPMTQLVTASNGSTLVAHPESFWTESTESYAANVALVDWDGDGDLDLILGNHLGELFVWLSQRGDSTGSYAASGIPGFRRASINPLKRPRNEIRVNDEKVLPAGNFHAAPAVGDWDGDGLWDILVGSLSGDVYFLRNTGELGAPQFRSRELILPGGRGFQVTQPGDNPEFGIRTQLHLTDYDGDGKLDLLAGCFVGTVTPRGDLSAKEREELDEILRELEAIDRQLGNDHREFPEKYSAYHQPANKALSQHVQALREKMRLYLKLHTVTNNGRDWVLDTTLHGNVWVFLRK